MKEGQGPRGLGPSVLCFHLVGQKFLHQKQHKLVVESEEGKAIIPGKEEEVVEKE